LLSILPRYRDTRKEAILKDFNSDSPAVRRYQHIGLRVRSTYYSVDDSRRVREFARLRMRRSRLEGRIASGAILLVGSAAAGLRRIYSNIRLLVAAVELY